MRWRFLDRIIAFEPWASLSGIKTVSFEEYSLMKPFGRKGAFPETFIMEACVASVQWLVMRSSGFEQTALLNEADNFSVSAMAGMGEVLHTQAVVEEKGAERLVVSCSVSLAKHELAAGTLTFNLVRLEPLWQPDNPKKLWGNVYGSA